MAVHEHTEMLVTVILNPTAKISKKSTFPNSRAGKISRLAQELLHLGELRACRQTSMHRHGTMAYASPQ